MTKMIEARGAHRIGAARAKALLCAGLLSLSLAASAAAEAPSTGIYIEPGRSPHGNDSTDALTLGATVPWSYLAPAQVPAISFHWDLFISEWRAPKPDGTGHRNFTQIGGIATWRYRFNEGTSPWFADAGIGATLMDSLYETPSRHFTTAFQFTEQLGIGRNLGERGEHELSLRLQHFSNGGIKKPNSGENFVRVRYLYRF